MKKTLLDELSNSAKKFIDQHNFHIYYAQGNIIIRLIR